VQKMQAESASETSVTLDQICCTLENEAAHSSEMLLTFYWTTWRHIPEDIKHHPLFACFFLSPDRKNEKLDHAGSHPRRQYSS
jgi:hypothetical protein